MRHNDLLYNQLREVDAESHATREVECAPLAGKKYAEKKSAMRNVIFDYADFAFFVFMSMRNYAERERAQ